MHPGLNPSFPLLQMKYPPEHSHRLLCDPFGVGSIVRTVFQVGPWHSCRGPAHSGFSDTVVSALEHDVSGPVGSPETWELGGDTGKASQGPCSELASECASELRQLGGED